MAGDEDPASVIKVTPPRWDRGNQLSPVIIPGRNRFYSLMRAILYGLSRLYFRLEVYGIENVPARGGVILVPNHASNLDPTTIACALPRQVHFLAKQELFVGLFGKGLTKVNAHPLKRSGVDRSALMVCREILSQGHVLMIFPEGQRSATGDLLPPRPGAALLAAQTRVPLVPVYIEGSGKAMPIGAKGIKRQQIRVYFGAPFQFDVLDVLRLPQKAFYAKAGAIIMEKIGELKRLSKHHNGK